MLEIFQSLRWLPMHLRKIGEEFWKQGWMNIWRSRWNLRCWLRWLRSIVGSSRLQIERREEQWQNSLWQLESNLIDNTEYFAKMKIWQEKEICEKYQGKYPVITLSLKSAKQPTFELAYQMIVEQIASEFKRHRYLLKSDTKHWWHEKEARQRWQRH